MNLLDALTLLMKPDTDKTFIDAGKIPTPSETVCSLRMRYRATIFHTATPFTLQI